MAITVLESSNSAHCSKAISGDKIWCEGNQVYSSASALRKCGKLVFFHTKSIILGDSVTPECFYREKNSTENNGQQDGIPTWAFIFQSLCVYCFLRPKHGN